MNISQTLQTKLTKSKKKQSNKAMKRSVYQTNPSMKQIKLTTYSNKILQKKERKNRPF